MWVVGDEHEEISGLEVPIGLMTSWKRGARLNELETKDMVVIA